MLVLDRFHALITLHRLRNNAHYTACAHREHYEATGSQDQMVKHAWEGWQTLEKSCEDLWRKILRPIDRDGQHQVKIADKQTDYSNEITNLQRDLVRLSRQHPKTDKVASFWAEN